jgi:predicted DNA repair protein MutK
VSVGLLALLDDVAALVKVSAASLDDISAQIVKTGSKVSGIVIDDAAVTPKYVAGLDPARELVIIGHIARQSLINKLLLLSPFILALNWLAPWALTPLLMLGGSYLCFEGYEKVHSLFVTHHISEDSTLETITPEALEQLRIKSAVTTDFILSAEIVAITYSTIANAPFINQIAILFSVGLLITVAVYGFVALIVKVDDIGFYLAKKHSNQTVQAFGRRLVSAMPGFLKMLGYIGTAAMLWVGGEIIAHGIPPAHHTLEMIEHYFQSSLLGWLIKAGICGLAGLCIGFCIAILPFLQNRKHKR